LETTELLIDTSIIIEHLRKTNKHHSILYNISPQTELFISSVTLFELQAGATDGTKQQDIKTLLFGIGILPFDESVAIEAGELYRTLKATNNHLEIRDLFIAATALTNKLPVLTLNRKHFELVKGLCLANVCTLMPRQ
jgi:tRNA(fMet)-specific endonuclease VapC